MFLINPLSFDAQPFPVIEPPRISALPESRVIAALRYIFVADSMVYLHSNFRGGLRNTRVL